MTQKPETEILCRGCEQEVPEFAGNLGPEGSDQPVYCPNCGDGPEPWVERDAYDFERDVDLPTVVSFDVYDDHYGLWNKFCEEVWGTRLNSSQIANVPDSLPKMKYTTFEVYFVIKEDDIDGPYIHRAKAKEKKRKIEGGQGND